MSEPPINIETVKSLLIAETRYNLHRVNRINDFMEVHEIIEAAMKRLEDQLDELVILARS